MCCVTKFNHIFHLIFPYSQRWNVYNRENRARVARDELAAYEKQEEERRRAAVSAASTRNAELLRLAQANVPRGAITQSSNKNNAVEPLEEKRQETFNASNQYETQRSKIQKERDEYRSRGKAETRTSDAQFVRHLY